MVSAASSTLTRKQAAVLDACMTYLRENGYPPTRRELASALGYRSVGSVQFHLDALARKGYIVRDAERPRALRWQETPVAPEGDRPGKETLAKTLDAQPHSGCVQVPVLNGPRRTSRRLPLPSLLAPEGAVAVRADESSSEASILRGDMLVLVQGVPTPADLVAVYENSRVQVVRWAPGSWEKRSEEVLGVLLAVLRRL